MLRLSLRLAVLACSTSLATACGGGSHAVPAAPASGNAAPSNAVAGVPQSAMRGVTISVHLPLRNTADLDALIARQTDKSSADYHHFLTPQQFRAAYGPTARDLAAAETALRSLGFETRVTSQSVIAAAPQPTVERAFNVQLRTVRSRSARGTESAARTSLGADRAPTLPAALAKLNATVGMTGLVRHVDSKIVSKQPYTPDNRYSPAGPYWFTDLKQAYGYPSYQAARGLGHTIAIVIDSDVLDSDLALYFGHEKLEPPAVERRPVDGGPRSFDPNDGNSAEASLDVQQSYGSAPGAHIMLYGIPILSDQDIIDAYTAIVEDNRADIVSSSFGLCELYYTAAYNAGADFTSILRHQHDVFRQGNAQGITFVASSGDGGAYGCLDPTFSFIVKGVESPADDSAVTGVGGTNLVTKSVAASRDSGYHRESAFFDRFDPAQGALPNQIWASGGGVSVLFDKPWYQHLVTTRANTRAIPDVAMHMGGCPVGSNASECRPDDSSVVTAFGGALYLLIGTSASAPEFAGLLAVTEQTLGTRLGNANAYIYLLAALAGDEVYRQTIPGNNGYEATPRYNYVVGNGTPHAAAFAAQPFAEPAGIPWTASNP